MDAGSASDFRLGKACVNQAADQVRDAVHAATLCDSAWLVNAYSHYPILHSGGMEPRKLLGLLIERAELTPHSLAAKLNKPALQGQLWRFLNGRTSDPRRKTLEPVAAYFRVPLEAFFDEAAADAVAAERGLLGSGQDQPSYTQPDPSEDAAPVLGAISAMLADLSQALASAPASRRKTIGSLLDRLANHPDELQDVTEQIQLLLPLGGDVKVSVGPNLQAMLDRAAAKAASKRRSPPSTKKSA